MRVSYGVQVAEALLRSGCVAGEEGGVSQVACRGRARVCCCGYTSAQSVALIKARYEFR